MCVCVRNATPNLGHEGRVRTSSTSYQGLGGAKVVYVVRVRRTHGIAAAAADDEEKFLIFINERAPNVVVYT